MFSSSKLFHQYCGKNILDMQKTLHLLHKSMKWQYSADKMETKKWYAKNIATNILLYWTVVIEIYICFGLLIYSGATISKQQRTDGKVLKKSLKILLSYAIKWNSYYCLCHSFLSSVMLHVFDLFSFFLFLLCLTLKSVLSLKWLVD